VKPLAFLLFLCAGLTGQNLTYRENCAACHGIRGDGAGPYAQRLLDQKPRDFTEANFRFRSTASGDLPAREDLARVILNGISLSSMPAFNGWLDEEDIRELTAELMGFSSRWKAEGPGQPVLLPARAIPLANDLTRLKGRALYSLLRCGECHGQSGKGDGPKAGLLADSKGLPVAPRDFTPGKFKSGPSDAEVVRSFMLGLDGTPMASFANTLTGQRPWYMLDHIRSFEEKQWFAKLFLFPAR